MAIAICCCVGGGCVSVAGEEVQPVVWDVVVATGMKGEVLLPERLELDVWAVVARDMVAQKSKWMVCRRSVQWR